MSQPVVAMPRAAAAVALLAAAASALPVRAPGDTASQYHLYEARVTATKEPANPFALFCHVSVDGPSASRHAHMNITMFYDGNQEWAWRFTPDVVGEWTWATACEPGYGLDGHQGTVQSTAVSDGRLGSVIVDPAAPTQMIYESGAPYTLVGLEVDWLWATGLLNGTEAMRSVVDGLNAIGVNHVLVQIYANSTSGSPLPPLTPPRVSPTRTTPWASADQQTLDLAFWRNYDAMLAAFASRDMVAHVMFFVGNKNVQWPGELSGADDIYWRTAMARFGAFPSIILDPSKETGSANSKRSVDYFVDRMQLMRSMNTHGRLLTSHSGFNWQNDCKQAPELCDFISAQIHLGDNKGVAAVASDYYPFLSEAAADATTPYIDVEFFYQWGPVDRCHFSCCNACTNESDLSQAFSPEENLREMRRVMWDHYMAGPAISGACWYHNDMGWDILDPRALTTTASVMATLRTLRSFWDGISRREYAVRAPELCVQNVQPSTAVIHCLVRTNSTGGATGMILHVRSDRASFELTVPPKPEREYTYHSGKNCYDGKGCDNIDDDGMDVSGPPRCARLCDALDDCECFVYHPSDDKCWRRKDCDEPAFLSQSGYNIYIKGPPKRAAARVTPTGFWLDPASTDSTTVPFVAAASGEAVQQPASFGQDAVLFVTF